MHENSMEFLPPPISRRHIVEFLSILVLSLELLFENALQS